MKLKDMCKCARQALKLSQKKFAEMIGTTQTEISFIENGFIPPNKNKAIAIMKIYNEQVRF